MREVILIFVLLVCIVLNIAFTYWLFQRVFAQNEEMLERFTR